MSLSAADLQKKHALEGAPDPFPALQDATTRGKSSSNSKPSKSTIDTKSEAAFPSLNPTAPKAQSTPSAWSAPRPNLRANPKLTGFTDTFDLAQIDSKTSGRDGKPTTLGEVMRTVMHKTGVTVEASSQRKTGQTTFIIKAQTEYALDTAKRILASRSASPYSAEPQDDENEPTVTITVTGPVVNVQAALDMIRSRVGTRTAQSTQRIKDIPKHVMPFVVAEKYSWEATAYESFPANQFGINVSEETGEVVIQGDKPAVIPTAESVRSKVDDLIENVTSVTVAIPRNQHRFVIGPSQSEEYMEMFRAVVVTSGQSVTIWGTGNLGEALNAVLAKSNSQHVETVDLPGPADLAIQIHTYLSHSAYFRDFKLSHPDVTVHVSQVPDITELNQGWVDFVGDRKLVKPAVAEFKDFLQKLQDGLKAVEIDWLVHKILIGKHGKKVTQFQDAHNVLVYFPPESSELSKVLLVYDPLSSKANTPVAEKQKHLQDVAQEILRLAAEAADVKAETITVEKKWHATIVGKQGATLNSIIGEEQTLSIKVGASAKLGPHKEALADDAILIRGPSSEVDRAIAEIRKIVEDAQREEIETSYVTEFDIPREYVARIVGAQGANVIKLRETWNVKIDFQDDEDENVVTGKGKRSVAKSHVKIQGRKKNADDARKRILELVDKFADETQEVLRIPRDYHPGLIGPSGKYVNRMEETHGVKINFPRDNAGFGEAGNGKREQLKPDEVVIKGGRKGVASAKAELLELVEFEKQHNHILKFNVPTRAIARILGRGGATINNIKDTTGAQIDLDKEESSPGNTTITVKGTVQETKEAKAAIMAIAAEVGEEATETLFIESKYHRDFIGKGGETLRNLIINAGGPTDSKAQAGLVHFPRYGESPDEVRLRGDKAVVAKLKKEMEKMAATYRDRVILGVVVPAAQHRSLIGRGGQNLNDLQMKTGTQIWFPGSRAYAGVGDLENWEELEEALQEDIVKVCGPREACEAAIAELTKPPAASSRMGRPPPQETITRTIEVPLKYHHSITHQGSLKHSLRPYGVFVDFSHIPEPFSPPRPAPTSSAQASTARIDQPDDDEVPSEEIEWQVVSNYEGAEEGDAEWTLRGRDEDSLSAAEQVIRDAISHAEAQDKRGYLTLADRSAFPRIVGSKGSNVSRIRAETETDIIVGKDDNTIIITGSEDAIEAAKEAILATVRSGGRGRYHDQY
ncbi:hypothetical protein FRB99_001452 [Tulasnella sp. 403]|nr:hypothetical protein FRB99_001452 [Tulasnella sp. 403]